MRLDSTDPSVVTFTYMQQYNEGVTINITVLRASLAPTYILQQYATTQAHSVSLHDSRWAQNVTELLNKKQQLHWTARAANFQDATLGPHHTKESSRKTQTIISKCQRVIQLNPLIAQLDWHFWTSA